MRDPQLVDEIRHRLDIVEIVADYIVLRRQGGRYLGLCPFHSEKTPSFAVSREKQFFHCFGCGTGGDVFTFVMLRENLTFPETLKKLAERAGVTLPEADLTPTQQAARTAIERGRALHRRGVDLFFRCLREDPRARNAREYLSRRGVTDSVSVAFGLGFAPPGWDFLSERLLEEGYTSDELERFGLAVRRQDGEGHYDRFRNRIMFPIFDAQGRPIAFGGRVLDNEVPKYLNSPETPLYKKGRHLYGLHKAGPSIREKGMAVLVEGYMDVIACHQHGITQAVASLGTALTQEQGRLLMRYAPRILICYDSDRAGIEATVKAGEILTGLGAQIRVLRLAEGKDPDEYLQKNGPANFWEAADTAPSFFVFRYQQVAANHDLTTVTGKVAAVRELGLDLLAIPSPVEQEADIQWLAREIRLSEDAILGELRGLSRNAKSLRGGDRKGNFRHTIPIFVNTSADQSTAPEPYSEGRVSPLGGKNLADRQEQAWRYLIYWMISDPERVRRVMGRLDKEIPQVNESLREIIEALVLASRETTGSLEGRTVSILKSEEAKRYLSALLVEDLSSTCQEPVVEDCINTIRYGWLLEEISRLEAKVDAYTQSGDTEALQRLLPQLASLQKARSRAARIHGAMPLGGRWEQRPWHKGGTADER